MSEEALQARNDLSLFSKDGEMYARFKEALIHSFERLKKHFGAFPSVNKNFIARYIEVIFDNSEIANYYFNFHNPDRFALSFNIDYFCSYPGSITSVVFHELVHVCNRAHHNEMLVHTAIGEYANKVIADKEVISKFDTLDKALLHISGHFTGSMQQIVELSAYTERAVKFFKHYTAENFKNLVADIGVNVFIAKLDSVELMDAELVRCRGKYEGLAFVVRSLENLRWKYPYLHAEINLLEYCYMVQMIPMFIMPFTRPGNSREKEAADMIKEFFEILELLDRESQNRIRSIYGGYRRVIIHNEVDLSPDTIEKTIHNYYSVRHGKIVLDLIIFHLKKLVEAAKQSDITG